MSRSVQIRWRLTIASKLAAANAGATASPAAKVTAVPCAEPRLSHGGRSRPYSRVAAA
jgi:hypothetical protein